MAHPINIFYKLRECYNAMRQSGSTVVLSIAAKNSGLIIVAPTEDSARLISREIAFDSPGAAISLHEFFRYVHGRRPHPWALDNHTVGYLCDKAIEIHDDWMQQVKIRDSEINKLVQEKTALGIQLSALRHENFELKTKLAVRKVRTITVRRKRF